MGPGEYEASIGGPKEFVSADGRRAFVGSLTAPDGFVSPFVGEDYVAVLWATHGNFEDQYREEMAHALIKSGCRYLVCGGVDCELWHDDADAASEALSTFVMTTWHPGESEEDVVFFAFNCTCLDYHDFKSFLFLFVGEESAAGSRMERLVRASMEAN